MSSDTPGSVGSWWENECQIGEQCWIDEGEKWGRRLIVKGVSYLSDPNSHASLIHLASNPPPGWYFWRGLLNMRHTRSLQRIAWRMEFMESDRAVELKHGRGK